MGEACVGGMGDGVMGIDGSLTNADADADREI